MTRSVAILGASTDRSKFGNKAVRAFIDEGWKVYPINPKAEEIEGEPCFPDLAALPEKVDWVTVYTPPQVTKNLLPEIASVQAEEVYFNPGSEDREVYDRAKELGIKSVFSCSIIRIGSNPGLYGDS